MPWKNGEGMTTELFKDPENSDNFDIRISVAQIKRDNTFSRFENIDRWIIILSGDAVHLEFNNQLIKLSKESPPFKFKGEDVIFCKMTGEPVTDFNLMVRRDYGSVSIEKVEGNNLNYISQDDYFFVYDLATKNLIILELGETWSGLSDKAIIIRINKRQT
jgi:environmental stress-induced protein Ves